jgi:hypothetical protein
MRNIATAKLLYRVLALGGLSLCLWAVSARTKELQDTFIPVVITDQLPTRAGIIPIFLSCGQARLSAANRIEEFRCTFKNNTSLNITAANTIYTIVLDNNGSSASDTNNLTIETLVHPDFRTTSKLIGPGDETEVGPPGPITYSNGAVVKAVQISIDYVQFENGTSLGPDKEGSRIVNAMRAGAQKYKRWLKAQYALRSQSVTALAADIEANESVAADVNEQLGAREYRRRFQKLLQTGETAEIKKALAGN